MRRVEIFVKESFKNFLTKPHFLGIIYTVT